MRSNPNNIDQAISNFTKAIQFDGTAGNYFQRAALRLKNNDFEGAEGDFSQLIKLDLPSN